MPFPFLGKKRAPSAGLAGEDRWKVVSGTYDGAPIVVRVNKSASAILAHPEFGVRLGIAVPLHAPDDHGFPRDEELPQLAAIEDRLVAAVDGAGVGRVVLIISTAGVREFISYIRSTEEGAEIAAGIRAVTTTHEVQHCTVDDGQWEMYRQFA